MRVSLVLPIVLASVLSTAVAQDPPPSHDKPPSPDKQIELRAKLSKKLAKKFIRTGGWELDYNTAIERAKREDKFLFVYFTRTFAP